MASNPHDGDMGRRFDDGSQSEPVTNRVRSASESSGLRHLFSKKKAAMATEEGGEEGEEIKKEGKKITFSKIFFFAKRNFII